MKSLCLVVFMIRACVLYREMMSFFRAFVLKGKMRQTFTFWVDLTALCKVGIFGPFESNEFSGFQGAFND